MITEMGFITDRYMLHVISKKTMFQSVHLLPQMSVHLQDDTEHQCQNGQRDGEEEHDWFVHAHAHADRHSALPPLGWVLSTILPPFMEAVRKFHLWRQCKNSIYGCKLRPKMEFWYYRAFLCQCCRKRLCHVTRNVMRSVHAASRGSDARVEARVASVAKLAVSPRASLLHIMDEILVR